MFRHHVTHAEYNFYPPLAGTKHFIAIFLGTVYSLVGYRFDKYTHPHQTAPRPTAEGKNFFPSDYEEMELPASGFLAVIHISESEQRKNVFAPASVPHPNPPLISMLGRF